MPHITITNPIILIQVVVIVSDHLQAGEPPIGKVEVVVRLAREFLNILSQCFNTINILKICSLE